jgi:ATPase subunit of ABC transporter with duplicated ATPase domains
VTLPRRRDHARPALYGAVRCWSAGLLVVSYDRQLLNLYRIVELLPQGLHSYRGNFDVYAAQRDVEVAVAERQL